MRIPTHSDDRPNQIGICSAQANPLAGLAALLQAAPSTQDSSAVEKDLDTAMDFINGL